MGGSRSDKDGFLALLSGGAGGMSGGGISMSGGGISISGSGGRSGNALDLGLMLAT